MAQQLACHTRHGVHTCCNIHTLVLPLPTRCFVYRPFMLYFGDDRQRKHLVFPVISLLKTPDYVTSVMPQKSRRF